jgi:hypothetical protein
MDHKMTAVFLRHWPKKMRQITLELQGGSIHINSARSALFSSSCRMVWGSLGAISGSFLAYHKTK